MVAAAPEVMTSRGLALRFQPDDRIISGIVRSTGEWEEPVAKAIEKYIKPGSLFLDLGAHVGYFSTLAASLGADVIAVEANPEAAELLRENAARNGLIIEVHAVAVTPTGEPAYWSLDPRDDGNPGAGFIAGAGRPVPATTLREVLSGRSPSVIKADIEGLEGPVLAAAPEVLANADAVVIEYSPAQWERYGAHWGDTEALLLEHGLHPRVSADIGLMEPWSYTNIIATREEVVPVAPATALVIAHREIAAPTVTCLFDLVGRGWPIAVPFGDALIDRARAKAVSQWFRTAPSDLDGYDVFLMIDDDIVFRPEDAERVVHLAREKRSIACAAYPVMGGGHLASRGWPGQEIAFGPDREPVEIRWPATGFMAVHRDVIAALTETIDECYPGEPGAFWPMFQPFALGRDYLSEDYAFGERARAIGFPTWLDPQSILIHLKVQGISVLNMPGAEVRPR